MQTQLQNKENKIGIFKNLTDTLFKKTEYGKTLYYGKGLLNRAYIVTDEQKKEKLYKFHKNINRYVLPLGIIYALLLGLGGAPLIGMLPIFIVAIILHYKQKSIVKDLPVYNEKMETKEVKKHIANAFQKPFLIFMIMNGSVAILTALSLPVIMEKDFNEIVVLMVILFIMGIFLLGIGWYLYKVKRG